MMRKLSIVLTAVALMAVMATAAFAQPSISGMVYLSNEVEFGSSDTTYTNYGFGRVNFSGNVSDNVGYYVRVQGDWGHEATGVSVAQAYVDVKNLLGSGSTLRLGRQSITGWSIFSYFYGNSILSGTRNAASLTVNAADNVTLRAFVDLVDDSAMTQAQYGAKATFDVGAGTLGFNVRSQVEGGQRKLGYSGEANVEFAGVNLKAEVGKNAKDEDVQIVGLGFDALTDAIGWDNFVEYNIASKSWAIGLSKTHDNKLTTAFTLAGSEGKETKLTTEVYVSF